MLILRTRDVALRIESSFQMIIDGFFAINAPSPFKAIGEELS